MIDDPGQTLYTLLSAIVSLTLNRHEGHRIGVRSGFVQRVWFFHAAVV